MLFLLFINSFSFNSSHLCFGWWFEQRHLSDNGFQVVRRSVTIPAWYNHFQFQFKKLSFEAGNKIFVPLLYHFLLITGWLWIKIFKYFLSQLMLANECKKFCFILEEPFETKEDSLILKIGISLDSEQIVPPVSEFSICQEEIQITDSSQVLQIPLYAETINEYKAPETVKPVPPVFHRQRYNKSIENEMKKFYNSLSEKDRRRFAGIEAMKLERGGIVYISEVLDCNRKTVSKGIRELKNLPSDISYQKGIRKPGGGRKNYRQTLPDIDDKFLDVIKNYTAGDPMKEGALWTNLSYERIADEILQKHGIKVSTKVTRQLIKRHKFGKRKLQKKSTMKQVKNRNEQFEVINHYKAEYEKIGNPILSIDSKKKEEIGNFFRPGYLYTQAGISVYDHDFKSFGKGVAIPHGIYDILKNSGWINLGTSKDTGEFACDSLREWWYNLGQLDYPDATSLLILCDGGGSNSSRHYIFKEDLQKLSDEIGIEIRIAHYPPYTSKYNPIEHRMFPHVTRACQGVVFNSIELIEELIEKTKTKKGLSVTVQIIDKVYETGRKVKEGFKQNMPIVFDEYLPQWNYRVIPNG